VAELGYKLDPNVNNGWFVVTMTPLDTTKKHAVLGFRAKSIKRRTYAGKRT